jgi:tetratricopeptide (TPR) repeat protein
MAYLAATYALRGEDAEAVNIWRTALLAGSDVPEIYVWLADSLMRRSAFGEAQPLLEDAVKRWPTDRRFLRLLAVLYGTAGRGREAADLLSQAIASNPDDVDSLALALEWLYSTSRDGKAFHTRAEDVQRARTYAEQYLKIGGPDEPLVRRWQSYFETQKP